MPNYPFNLTMNRWCFTPKLKPTLSAIIVIICFVYLGEWQLQRAQYKKNLAARLQTQIAIAPLPLTGLTNPSLQKDRFLPVSIEGEFMNQHTLLVDNQTLDGKPGFRVLTPMQAPQLKKLVLIDRGWIHAADRSRLPTIAPVLGTHKITGHIDAVATGLVLVKDKIPQHPQWPLIIQAVDYQLISQLLHSDVYNFVIQMQPNADFAFNVLPPVGVKHTKHIAYAVQWFSFAVLVFIYYLIITIKRSKNAKD